MRFRCEMGVSHGVAVHLRDLGLQRLPDADNFARAAAERRIVLTFDLDFGEIAARSAGPWASVVVFRLSDTTSPHVCARLDAALAGRGRSPKIKDRLRGVASSAGVPRSLIFGDRPQRICGAAALL